MCLRLENLQEVLDGGWTVRGDMVTPGLGRLLGSPNSEWQAVRSHGNGHLKSKNDAQGSAGPSLSSIELLGSKYLS